jgi:hypothetical protein
MKQKVLSSLFLLQNANMFSVIIFITERFKSTTGFGTVLKLYSINREDLEQN